MQDSPRVLEWIEANQKRVLSRAWSQQTFFKQLAMVRAYDQQQRSQVMRYSAPVSNHYEIGRSDKLRLRAVSYSMFPNHDGSIIRPYSCRNVSDDFSSKGWIYFKHDKTKPPVARVMEAEQHENGIDIVARWEKSQRARDLKTILRERQLSGHPNCASAGLKIARNGQRMERVCGDTLANVIDDWTLQEVSLVRRGADDSALVTLE
jgi:hypothetical protein